MYANSEGPEPFSYICSLIRDLNHYHFDSSGITAQLAFYVNLHRAVIGPSATLTGRWRPDIDLCRMLTGSHFALNNIVTITMLSPRLSSLSIGISSASIGTPQWDPMWRTKLNWHNDWLMLASASTPWYIKHSWKVAIAYLLLLLSISFICKEACCDFITQSAFYVNLYPAVIGPSG